MLKRITFSILLVLFAGYCSLAHETWIEKRNGDVLVLRGHGGTAEPYDSSKVKEAKALDAKGQSVQMEIVKNKENASLKTKGDPVVVGALYDSGYWLKTTDGWKKATKREGKGKYSIVESLKSKQWCKTLLKSGDQNAKPLGQRFEIVPQKDPMTIGVGGTLPVKVVFDGKPMEGATVLVGGGHTPKEAASPKTNKDGEVSLTIERSGLQLLKATKKIPTKNDPDADLLSLSSTVTFVVK